ncbi:Kinesin-like protein KIF23 [Nymphon striatum]|nr:Kinesin-like protein KIF23 [Nymphon striatum]
MNGMMKPSRNNITPAPARTPARKFNKPRSNVRDPVEVYCRLRPLYNENEENCVVVIDESTIQLNPPEISLAGRNGQKALRNTFKYVFDANESQSGVFTNVSLPLVEDLIKGKNGLLFAYGVTSSGKTHTMTGTPEQPGIMPRFLDVIFNSINELQARKYVFIPDKMNGFDVQSNVDAMLEQQKGLELSTKTPKASHKKEAEDWGKRPIFDIKVENADPDYVYAVFVSYIEVYNNYVYDLLENTDTCESSKVKQQSKILREDVSHNMYIHACTEIEVKSTEEAFAVFYRGQKRRRLAQTVLNCESSRSHSIFNIRLVQAPLDTFGSDVLQDKSEICISQLSLVDLAGSERTARTQNTGSRLKEASSINKTLMALRTCIEVLRENQMQGTNKLVPYRDTKLTHLFKNYFDGEGKVRMIVCINPRADDYDETIHVMRFAEMTQEVLISRPPTTPHKPNLGLMPGRGILFREAVKKAKEEGVRPEELVAPVLFTLGPSIPEYILENPSDDKMLPILEQHLIDKLAKKRAYLQELEGRQTSFRDRLIAFENEYGTMKDQWLRIQADLKAREQQIKILERKLAASEETNDSMRRKVYVTEKNMETLHKDINEKDQYLGKNQQIMKQYKVKVQEQFTSERERMKRLMEKRLHEKQAELESKMCLNEEKLRQLQDILNADDWCVMFDPLPVPAQKPRKKQPAPSTPMSKSSQSSSDTKLNSASCRPATRSRSPVFNQRKTPVANSRHRRSQSSNADVWIDHRPIGNLELDTVLKPKLKKKKSVSQLNMKDITNDASKYLLTNQEQLSDGNLKTEYYKGDVIPTSGGGAQVIFQDVEILNQNSPPYNFRKRRSCEEETVMGEVIKNKCSTGIEGHAVTGGSNYKKSRH